MPIEDSTAARAEAAALNAQRAAGASRNANDLNEGSADKADAVTRSQIGKADTLAPQPRPRGPQGGGPRGPKMAPGTVAGGKMADSAVITG
jgi:hypothetical protein